MKTTKNTWYVALVVLVCIATGSACKKNDDGPGGSAAPGTIKAKIGHTAFTSNPQFSTANRVNVGSTATITLQGNDQSGKGIVLVINGVDAPDTYAIGGGANVSISASYIEVNVSDPAATQTWQAPFDSSVAGEVTITALSAENIQGVFSFTAKNAADGATIDISDGAFNMNF